MKARWFRTAVAMVLWQALAACTLAAPQIQSFCRLKGQEPIRLTGLGLVTGLNGTGDSRFTPMHSAVAEVLRKLGSPVLDLRELTTVRNVALVAISCEIPGVGGREGDVVECFVTSIGTARSLRGGRLLRAPLQGPVVSDPTAYAIAEGPVSIEDLTSPNHGRVTEGAKLTTDLFAPYIKCEDTITLVIDKAHAGFVTANRIASEINRRLSPQTTLPLAQAVDARNVEIKIPEFAQSDVVRFVADIMEFEILAPHTQARVVVNERTGVIAVSGEVEMSPTLVTHRNLVIFPGGAIAPPTPPNDLTPLVAPDPPFPQNPELANLNDLLIALNRAQVSADDKIAIIKELAKSGKLHAQVVYE